MPPLKTYNLFISHSWAYSGAYERLVSFFNEYPNFKYVNYSVPKDDPVHIASDEELHNAIENKIRLVNCVVILAGVYATYSKWIKEEIDIAKSIFAKPIVAVEGWGSEKTSTLVKDHADRIVKWNSKSIVSAIREISI